jgi:hypothetical protein
MEEGSVGMQVTGGDVLTCVSRMFQHQHLPVSQQLKTFLLLRLSFTVRSNARHHSPSPRSTQCPLSHTWDNASSVCPPIISQRHHANSTRPCVAPTTHTHSHTQPLQLPPPLSPALFEPPSSLCHFHSITTLRTPTKPAPACWRCRNAASHTPSPSSLQIVLLLP